MLLHFDELLTVDFCRSLLYMLLVNLIGDLQHTQSVKCTLLLFLHVTQCKIK